ncbi:MAG: NRDE family protein [Smithellaceae bacterium]
MCLIVFAYNVHPSYHLILAANRDEFYERPSSPADFWEDAPQILAGKDLKEGGTWLGITREGKFAAITNYRDPATFKINAQSRGKLVSRYISGNQSANNYLEKISRQIDKYNGFNLILGDRNNLFAFSNRGEKQKLNAGIYGLSNHLLDTPWPKVRKAKKELKRALNEKGAALEDTLFALLSDRRVAPDDKLPATGVGREWERLLSPIFIKSANYGTRSSTILLIGKNKRVKFVEKVFDEKSELWLTSRFSFITEKEK